MLDEWYYKVKEAEIGPIAWDDLKWLADHDQLDRNALVRQGQTGNWLLAKRIKGLIDLSKPLVLPGVSQPTSPSAVPPPAAPPRQVTPTMSFVPSTNREAIAMPPVMSPPVIKPPVAPPSISPPANSPSLGDKTPPATKTSQKMPGKPPAARPASAVDEWLPPPAIPKPPPRKSGG